MKRELICYKCTCGQCGHNWTTRTHELPKVCAKCKSVKWDDDQPSIDPVPEPAPVSVVAQTGEWVETERLGSMNAKMAAILSSVAKPAPVVTESTWAFTRDPVQYADNGNCYRQQYDTANPKRRRTVQVDEVDHDLPLDN